MSKITDQPTGSLNEQDRLELARLLIKAGYTVRIGRTKESNRQKYTYFIEFTSANESAGAQ